MSQIPKAWTVMVYMAGDNNMDPDGVTDLLEMKKVGSTKDINVIAQFDRATGHAAQRYCLRKGGSVEQDAVMSVGRVNTGDPKNLIDFIGWGIKNYPAERCLLVLWNHGQGWDDTDIFAGERMRRYRRLADRPTRHALFHTPVRRMLAKVDRHPVYRAILVDENAKDFLDNQEMKKVVSSAAKRLHHKLDILGMDACLMSMAEVGYQIRGSTAFTVGSEQTEPMAGWPYDTILAALAQNPALTAEDVSSMIVTKYLASYSRESVTQSACDLAQAEALAGAVAKLAAALRKGIRTEAAQQAVMAARMRSQTYYVADNIDLVDFCSQLEQKTAGSDIAARCREVIQAAQAGYVRTNGCKGSDLKNSHGVAIYFPNESVSPLYAKLDFCRKTKWGDFLKEYLASVRGR
ncbi:MAG: clostripain-related cysteine peptidase [Anaerolineales bacterium]